MLRFSFFTYLVLFPILLWSQHSSWVEGTVFIDKNKNQLLDPKERGLKDIAVSNGKDIVYTDSKGKFRIEVQAGQSVFPIVPSGYTLSRAKGEQVNNSFFFYPDSPDRLSAALTHHFALIAEKQPNSFRIGAIGDIQVGDIDELNYAGKSIFSELAGRRDIAFHLILGDLVNDDTHLLPPFKAMLQMLPSPSWTVLGNHDRNTDKTSPLDRHYNQEFGASTYAFNYGGRHFIVLNNVFSTGTRSYEGRVSDDQLQFLKADLEHLPKETQVVLCQHIPMLYTRNREEVLTLLKPFSDVLLLSGHTHQVSRHFYNQGQVHEIVAGAPSGNWWTGEANSWGVPDALMQCGSPRNYFTIDFDKTSYRIHFKGIGLDNDQQLDLTLRGDTLITNLYAASDSTMVQVQIDNGEWLPMQQAKRPAESVLQIIEMNKEKKFPASGKRINPLRLRASPHIWQTVINPLDPGVHTIRIKAFDRFGYHVEKVESFVNFVPTDIP